MTRRKLVAGNWKMHQTLAESRSLSLAVRQRCGAMRQVDVILFPPFTALASVKGVLEDSRLALGAQDLYFKNNGAYTGAIGGALLKDAGAGYVLVGHSERRALFGETLESTRLRMDAALDCELWPILCVGETAEERADNRTQSVISAQVQAAIAGLSGHQIQRISIAYEPVWAIGTGHVALAEQAQAVHVLIRDIVRGHTAHAADNLRILYGGSVKPQNAAELFSQPDIDGGLVGGASLDADAFVDIVKAAQQASQQDV